MNLSSAPLTKSNRDVVLLATATDSAPIPETISVPEPGKAGVYWISLATP